MENLKPVEILIVEDNPNDAELTLWALKEQKLANEIVVLEDGAEALDFLLRKGKFAKRTDNNSLKVIFLDLKLPKINGLEVLEEIKKRPETQKIPVVVVTSSGEDPDIKAAYELGANSYVVKPVNFEDFVHAMKQAGMYWLLVNQMPK